MSRKSTHKSQNWENTDVSSDEEVRDDIKAARVVDSTRDTGVGRHRKCPTTSSLPCLRIRSFACIAIGMLVSSYALRLEHIPTTAAPSEEKVIAGPSLDFDRYWPDLKRKMCPGRRPNPNVWFKLFKLARIELDFADDRISLDEGSKFFIQQFFKFSSGGIGFKSQDSMHHFIYLRIYKGGNNQIRENLDHTLRQEGSTVWAAGDTDKLFSSIPRTALNQTCIVTAARDPVEHFLSGYNELECRIAMNRRGISIPEREKWRSENYFGAKNILQHYTRFANGTASRFEQFVVDLIGGALSPLAELRHTFSMTGVLLFLETLRDQFDGFSPQLTSYLPSLANLDEEFPKLLKKTCNGLPPNATKPFSIQTQHHSASDPFGFYSAAKKVISENESIMKALCIIHALDYACFE